MKKKVKIFKSGKYNPQGDYSAERVKAIFEKSAGKTVDGIFAHTSHHKSKKAPVVLGAFSDFEFKDFGEEVEVYANITLNEKGKTYYEDGAFEGISVELPGDTLTKIALLPVGVNPAVAGAQFEGQADTFVFEFEEIDRISVDTLVLNIHSLTIEEKVKIINALTSSVTSMDRQGMRKLLEWEKLEEIKGTEKSVDEFEGKSSADIAKIVTERLKSESKAKEQAREFMQNNSLKITPAMKEAGLTEEFMTALLLQKPVAEFEESKFGLVEVFKKVIEGMPGTISTGEVFKTTDFSKDEGEIKTNTSDRFSVYG